MSLTKRTIQKADGTQTVSYHYDFRLGGKRYQGATGCSDKRKAAQFEKGVRDAALKEQAARAQDPDRLSVGDVIQKYYLVRVKGRPSEATTFTHLMRLEDSLGVDTVYASIDSTDVARLVEGWMGQKTGKGKTINGAGMNRMIIRLRGVHLFAKKALKVPVQDIEWSLYWQKEAGERIRYLTPEQARALSDALPQHIAVAMLWTLFTGARMIETRSLRWDRIDWSAKSAEVLTKGGNKKQLMLGVQALRLLQGMPRTGEFVFDLTNHQRSWEKALAKCGIDDFHWHDLRHTTATWLGHRGVGLQVIQTQTLDFTGVIG
jgi:integrase